MKKKLITILLITLVITVMGCAPKSVSMDLDQAQYYYNKLAGMLGEYSRITQGIFVDSRAPTNEERVAVLVIHAEARILIGEAKRDLKLTDGTIERIEGIARILLNFKP